MSTISAALARGWPRATRPTAAISSPPRCSAGPTRRRRGKLWVLHSGAADRKARARPVLEAISQGIVDIGEAPDAAPTGKIAGNFLIAAAMEAMSEAFALLEKSGVDARIWHDLMARSLFACPIYANYGRLILDRAFSPPGFKLALGAKDVGLALAAGQAAHGADALRLGPARPASCRDRAGAGDLDWTAISLGAKADAGLKV